MKRISVLLIEDHMVVREGLRRMLELDADLQVVGEAQDGRQALTHNVVHLKIRYKPFQ